VTDRREAWIGRLGLLGMENAEICAMHPKKSQRDTRQAMAVAAAKSGGLHRLSGERENSVRPVVLEEVEREQAGRQARSSFQARVGILGGSMP